MLKFLSGASKFAAHIARFAAIFLAIGAAMQAFDNEFKKHVKEQKDEERVN